MVVNSAVILVLRVELIKMGENPEAFFKIFSQKVMFWEKEFCVKKMTQKNEMKNFMTVLGVDVNYSRFWFKVRIFNYGICDFYLYDKNNSQNALIYIFIINKRRFLAAYTLHRTLHVLMHIARQINESFALSALHELNVKE